MAMSTEAKAVTEVLATEAGKELFFFLFKICGYDQTSMVIDVKSGALDLEKTLYNEARRAVYIQLRALAMASSPDALKSVEFRAVEMVKTEAKTEEKK